MPIQSEQYIDISGSELYVKRVGKGRPIFFLHGGPGSEHRFFLPYVLPLAEQFELIFYDQRGCGKSIASKKTTYSMEDEINNLEYIRSSLGLDNILLFGESWGSMLALMYAATFPEHVNKILLTAAIGITSEGLKVFEKELDKRLSKKDKSNLSRLEKGLNKGTTCMDEILNILDPYYVYNKEKLRKKQKISIVQEVNHTIGKDIESNYNLTSKLDILSRIPILVAQGEYDILSPALINKLMINDLPHVTLTEVKDAGHWTVIEQAEEMMRITEEFFNLSN
ncbi:alpha/beta fold hydrolase [Bacillus cereus]|uniref:alpha/beta fold hydrolase n=1 Tax=Bacillus cereus TaxID=1396 RepID=UPI0025B039AE|nr:alpha/beta hydrolase [Bacillus cereus]WJX08336.1 alpha/beta hydrolase [Bacillus cereus]